MRIKGAAVATDFFAPRRYTWGTSALGGEQVTVYLDVAVALNFLVDLLLLLGADRLSGYPCRLGRCAAAAALGAVYAGACLVPGFRFLGGGLWRVVCLGAMIVLAYGFHPSAVRRGLLFLLLSLALGGAAMGLGSGSFLSLVTGAGLVAVLCALGLRGGTLHRELVEVELARGEAKVKLMALKDTGNTLVDPVTGQSVLVADAQSAAALLGLTRQQLADPAGTVASGVIPGLRLIPYRAVGMAGGMLVALRLEQVRIGKWQGSALVAFAPEGLGGDGNYRALTGGMA